MSFFAQYSIYIMLAIAAIINTDWLIHVRKRLDMSWYAAPIFAILFEIFCLLSVKIFAVAEYGFDFSKFGYMSLFGGLFLVPVALCIGAKLFKRSIAEVCDIFAICAVVTVLCARINCLFAGCCLGTFIPGMELRWPTREVEVIFYAAFLLVFIPRVFKKKTYGEVYPFYMLSYGVLRFILEFLRVTDRTESLFHLSHVWALISTGIGLAFVLYLRKKNRVSPKTARHK